MSDYPDKVREYYKKRGFVWPNFDNAMKFALTEIGEIYEVDLARQKSKWVRNNPQNKPTFSKDKLAEEIGDCIFMLIVAGIVEGIDPIQAMEDKMKRTLPPT